MDSTGPHLSTPHLTTKRRTAVLAVMCLALMMVVAAVASLNVALPDLARATGATQSQLQWIVDAYALVFAGLLLPAGALGDRFGRKGVLLAGLVVFGSASLAAMFVDDPSVLIGLRAVIGVGAALVMPTTLSIITNVFPEDERGRAVGIWAGIAGGGAIIGLLLSGLLLEWFSWPSVFALNVVLAVLALAGTLAVVPTSREPAPRAARPDRRAAVVARPLRSRVRDHRGAAARLARPRRGDRLRRRRRAARGVRALRAPPRRADARPAPVRPPRLRRRLDVADAAVLRAVRLPLHRAPVPAVRARRTPRSRPGSRSCRWP